MKILICGVGAIGSNLAALLACDLKGEHEITVLDKDAIEERNVQAGTQFYQKDQIGMSKVEALQYNIYKWYERNIDIEGESFLAWPVVLENGLFDKQDFDLVIDCFDNQKARQNLQDGWKEYGIEDEWSLLHLGFSDQFTFAIEWAENYEAPSDIKSDFDICTMSGASSFVKMVASLGSLVIQEFIKDGKKMEFIGNKFTRREIK